MGYPYASQLQIQYAAGGPDRLVALTDWASPPLGAVNSDVIAQAQANADGWIDSYLRLRYSTPIANPSATLARLSADECVYWLRKTRGMLGEQDVAQRKEREHELQAMSEGKIRPDEPVPAASTAVVATVVDRVPTGSSGSCVVDDELAVSRDGMKGVIW